MVLVKDQMNGKDKPLIGKGENQIGGFGVEESASQKIQTLLDDAYNKNVVQTELQYVFIYI